MFGKIVQLLGTPMEEGFEAVYGAHFDIDMSVRLDFATIFMGGTRKPGDYMYVQGGISIGKEQDGYKELNVCKMPDEYIDEEAIEDTLVVIIPYSSIIVTTAKKVAGRYPTEAILEMHAGDTVKVQKADSGIFEMHEDELIGVGVSTAEPETYMAVQAGNELLLVKKYR